MADPGVAATDISPGQSESSICPGLAESSTTAACPVRRAARPGAPVAAWVMIRR